MFRIEVSNSSASLCLYLQLVSSESNSANQMALASQIYPQSSSEILAGRARDAERSPVREGNPPSELKQVGFKSLSLSLSLSFTYCASNLDSTSN